MADETVFNNSALIKEQRKKYQATCEVCGTTGEVNEGWCKIISYDKDYNKSTSWMCPKHYKEFVDSGENVIPTPEKCPIHPRYQGKRKPRADCGVCDEIWNARRSDAQES